MNYHELILKELESIKEEDKHSFLQGALWGFELASEIAKQELNK